MQYAWLLVAAIPVNAQNLKNLKAFKNGTFKFSYNNVAFVIERTGNTQIEYKLSKPNDKFIFNVEWLMHTLIFLTPKNKSDIFPAGAKIIVKVTNTTDSSYKQTSTYNFASVKISTEFIRMR